MLQPLLRITFALLLAGCASDGIETSSSFDPLHAFPAEATYAWDDAASRLPTDPRLAALDLGPLIRQAADAELAARGYRVAGAGADYRLAFTLSVYSWIGPDNSRSVGSLALSLVESATGREVWQGWARAEVHVALTPEERMTRMRRAMAGMLARFPPPQRPGR